MKNKKILKRTLIGVGAFIGLILIIALIYVAYVFIQYNRIEDNQKIEPINISGATAIKTNETITITSYNIGFGAYSDDYSFFMDGGKYSRAFSKDAVIENTNGSIDIVKKYNPDLMLFQEVDTGSTRSYQIDQTEMLKEEFNNYSSSYGVNYHSAYLFYPILEPHGKSNSGLLTFSKFKNESAIRRSLPISTGFSKILDLDRCYVKNYIPTDDGHYLVLINTHLSAYTSDVSIVHNQIKMLSEDMQAEYEKGNYVICGGDFNQDLLGNSPEIFGTTDAENNWAKPFPKDLLTKNFSVAIDSLSKSEIEKITPSCRNADIPYEEGKTFITMVDGFIVSDNIEIENFDVINNEFKYSDHNPVIMKFVLKSDK